MSTNALAILGDGYKITITPEAEAQKKTIIDAARRVVAVTDQDSCDLAQARLKALGSVRTAVEKSRTDVKAPVIALGREIDGIAKDFVAEVITEEARLSGLVNEFAREQQRIAREAAAAAERERQRIERERHEAEMKALLEQHEAEMARLRAARESNAAAEAEAREREEAARRQQEEAAQRAREARRRAEAESRELAEREAAANAAIVTTQLPAGVKEQIDFEVTDIHVFAAKFPQLVTITPKRADILAALKKSFAKNEKLPDVPGLRVFQNLKVGR